MSRRKAIRLLLFAVTLLFALGACGGTSRADDVRVVILHTNDLHGQVNPAEAKDMKATTYRGGLSAIALQIQEVRKEAGESDAEVIVVDAGDFYQGTPLGNIPPGRLMTEFFNLAGYDYVTLGNHEYDHGEDALRKFAELAKFTFLGANIIDKKSGKPPDYVKPYVVREIEGVKLAFVGLTHPEMAALVLPKVESGLSFPPEEETLTRILAEEAVKNADYVVLISHIGMDRDKEVAKRFPRVALIIGGHSHSITREPVYVGVGKAAICHTGDRGNNLGRVNLVFDSATRKLLSFESRLLPLVHSERVKDEATEQLIEKDAAPLRATFGQKAGTAELDFPRGGRQYSGVSSPLGNLVTDVMREATGVDMAFHNRTGMRADLAKGEITKEHLYDVSPFGNTLVTMDLTGAEVLEAIEYSLSNSQFFLEVSGVEYSYNPREEVGKRVRQARVGSAVLDTKKSYRVVTNSFIADGGDGHAVFTKGKNVKGAGVDLFLASVEYAGKHSPLARIYEKRIAKAQTEEEK